MSILFIGISFILFQKMFKIKFSTLNLCLYTLINLAILLLCNLYLDNKYSYFFMFLCSMIIFIFLQKISVLKTLNYFGLNAVLVFNIVLLFSSLFASPAKEIASVVVYFMIALGTYFLFRQEKIKNLFSISENNKSYVMFASSIINLLLIFCTYYFSEIFYHNIIYVLLLDTYFVFSTILNIALCKIIHSNCKIDNLKLCNKTILSLYDGTRAFKHDFHNIIQALGGYITNKDLPGLQVYYQDILKECKMQSNLSKLNENLINNPAIYNILANKYYIASENDIEVSLEILLNFNELNMKIYEFTRILGILLDNAIEAAKECTHKHINICFKKDNYRQLLIIENTYNDKQISIDKIFEKNFSTKQQNTGLGLWEVRRILNKHSHLNLHTTKNEQYFSQQLEIYTNSELRQAN